MARPASRPHLRPDLHRQSAEQLGELDLGEVRRHVQHDSAAGREGDRTADSLLDWLSGRRDRGGDLVRGQRQVAGGGTTSGVCGLTVSRIDFTVVAT